MKTEKLTVIKKIEFCLANYPETRNSDLVLLATLCQRFMPAFERPIQNWSDLVSVMRVLPSLDHVARMRRIVIQRNKYQKYLPTDPMIAKQRGINELDWQNYIERTSESRISEASNYPPDVAHKLATSGRTGVDD